MIQKLTAFRLLFCIGFALLLGFFAITASQQKWLETDLQALLPTEQVWRAEQQQAEKIQERRLNRQLVAMVGNLDRTLAFEQAKQLAEKWRASGVFASVTAQIQPDLNRLRADLIAMRLALLPETDFANFLENPTAYFQHYATQIANPFGQTSLISPEQDWLGLSRFILPASQSLSALQWDQVSGLLWTEENGKTWVLINAELPDVSLFSGNKALLALTEQSRQMVDSQGGELLLAGTALFSAHSQQQAEQESTLMSIAGVSLTLLLLFSVFRSGRVLWLFVPILCGLLGGVAATVLLLGKIHVLTLVVGTSLVGVLIDFPLHWLASSRFHTNWQAEKAMKQLRSTFVLSLLVTLLGYVLLWFTILPVLKQTALFSAVALLIALLATMLFLPLGFRTYRPKIVSQLPNWKISQRLLTSGAVLLFVFVSVGLYKSQWRDDLRQWVALPENMLKEAASIADLSGISLSNQAFLIVAENDEKLLETERQLSVKLTELGVEYQALSQWFYPQAVQKQRILQMSDKILPLTTAPLQQLGIPFSAVEQDFNKLKQQPEVSLSKALNSPLGQSWSPLYLGSLTNGKVASLVKITKTKSTATLATLADEKTIFWQDKRSSLNQAFEESRNQAAWLKGVSLLLAGLLLWRLFSFAQAIRLLAIPVVGMLCAIATLGWLGVPVGLFAMFGLLLVSAIGVDYAVYLHTAPETLNAKRFSILLAAATTMISFGLLAFSQTPAVTSFGLSVTLGILFCLIFIFGENRNESI